MSILGLIIILILITIFSKKIREILKIIIPTEIYYTFSEFYLLIKEKPLYICFFLILLTPITIIISIMALVYIIYLLNLIIKFIYFFSIKKYNVLYYKNWKTKFKNYYIIIIKKIFWEKPTTMCFFSFYTITKIIWEKKRKMNVEFVIIFIWNIIIRVTILMVTKTPLIIIKTTIELLLKTNNIISNNEDKKNLELIKYIIGQYIISSSSELNYVIKKLKIKFLKNKIKFNFDVKKYINMIKDKKGLKEALFLTKQKTEINFIKHIKSDDIPTEKIKKYYLNYNLNMLRKMEENNFFKEKYIKKQNLFSFLKKEEKLDKKINKFIEDNIEKTKPHLTILYKNSNGDVVYKNESSKEEIWIYNKEKNELEPLKLKFIHEGSLDKNKKTFFTPNTMTNKENVLESNIEKILEKVQNIENKTHNLLLSFLLDAKKEGLRTQYIDAKGKFCLMREDKDTRKNILKILDQDKIIKEAREIFENFLENNKEIFEYIEEEEKEEMVRHILSSYYKTELFKDEILVFYILKK